MKSMKILCIGHIAFDVTLQMASFPVENTRNEIQSIEESGGGMVSNAACLLGKWGAETYICGVMGYDSNSEKIRKEFTNYKVKTDFLEIDYEKASSISYIIIDSAKKMRTIMSRKSELPPIKKDDYGKIPVDVILLDGYEYNTSIKTLKNCPACLSILDARKASKEI